jgi:Membrane protein involved in the export of O-antigen and teichoic acid
MFDFYSNNYHKVFKDLSWTFISQSLGNLLRFLLIFVVIRCYSKEEFGLWASITSLAAVIITGDFGLTSVLRNIASEGLSKGLEGECNTKNAWLSAVVFLSLFAFVCIIILFIINGYPIFEQLFKTDNPQLKMQGNNIVLAVITVFLLNLPFGLTGGLFLSYGEVKEGAIFSLISGILTFISVISLSIAHIRIDIVSIVFFVSPLLINIISTLYFLNRRKWSNYNFSVKEISRHVFTMLPSGIKFVGIGSASNFIFNALTIYSGAMLGLSAAANINVAQKIYTFFASIMVSLLNPIWANLSRSFYSKEYQKCKKMLKISFLTILVVSIFIILATTLFRDVLLYIIAGGNYKSNVLDYLLVGGCLMGKVLFDNASLLLTAINKLNTIVIGYLLFSAIVLYVFPKIVIYWGFDYMMMILIILWIIFIIVVIFHTRSVINKTANNRCLFPFHNS